MTGNHKCPKCKKNWKCITDLLFEKLQPKGKCDMPKNSQCYKCSGMGKEMIQIQEQLEKVIIMKASMMEHGLRKK